MSGLRYIAYYRVSTQRQGRSGLGLEAQQKAVKDRLAGFAPLLAEYIEIESGTRTDRPKLAEALAACRLHKAILIIAKLDRLARNVAFVSNLMEAGVDFEAVDHPTVNRLTIHILAAVAEHEARMISERTRSALAAAKARGVKLGGYRGRPGTAADCSKARLARSKKAANRAADLIPTIKALQASGVSSLRSIASELNRMSIAASRGGTWSAGQVGRVLKII